MLGMPVGEIEGPDGNIVAVGVNGMTPSELEYWKLYLDRIDKERQPGY